MRPSTETSRNINDELHQHHALIICNGHDRQLEAYGNLRQSPVLQQPEHVNSCGPSFLSDQGHLTLRAASGVGIEPCLSLKSLIACYDASSMPGVERRSSKPWLGITQKMSGVALLLRCSAPSSRRLGNQYHLHGSPVANNSATVEGKFTLPVAVL
jgi:hypothetical protein